MNFIPHEYQRFCIGKNSQNRTGFHAVSGCRRRIERRNSVGYLIIAISFFNICVSLSMFYINHNLEDIRDEIRKLREKTR